MKIKVQPPKPPFLKGNEGDYQFSLFVGIPKIYRVGEALASTRRANEVVPKFRSSNLK